MFGDFDNDLASAITYGAAYGPSTIEAIKKYGPKVVDAIKKYGPQAGSLLAEYGPRAYPYIVKYGATARAALQANAPVDGVVALNAANDLLSSKTVLIVGGALLLAVLFLRK